MITETLIKDANEKIKSLYSENKNLWFWIYILICISIVFYFSKIKKQFRN